MVGARRGFALTELAAVIVVGAVLAAMLLIMGGESKRQARLGEDLGKMRQIAAGTMSYAADFEDLRWGFSWEAGVNYPGFGTPPTSIAAGAAQLASIIREHGGIPNFQPIQSLFVFVGYSHLPFEAYVADRLTTQMLVSAADRHRLLWSADPAGYSMGLYAPNFGTGFGPNQRHPFTASFRTPMAFMERSLSSHRASPGSTTGVLLVPSTGNWGVRPMTLVSHPSQKVMLYDTIARYQGARNTYATHDEARVPVLMADGAAGVRAAVDSNRGANPTSNPATASPVQMQYSPSVIDPPALPGSFIVYGRFEWTRGMLSGRDFGGREAW